MKNALLVLLVALGCSACTENKETAPPRLSLTLTPVLEHGTAVAMDVAMELDTGKPLPALTIARTLGPLQRIDQRIINLQIADSKGSLGLHDGEARLSDALGQKPRAWQASRPTEGKVNLRYRVLVSQENIPGPTWELRAEPRGISAAGNSFLVLPDDEQPYKVTVKWDLSAFLPEARALDSLPSDGIATPQRIASSYFMAGILHTLDEPTDGQFRAVSTADTTQFSQKMLLKWAHNAYLKYSDYFGFPQLPPFTVMFRSNPLISKSGTELPDALMVAANNNISLQSMQQILSHEMVHVFLHGLEGASWFQEGLAVMYESRTPYALGLIDHDTYLSAVNNTLQTYYSNVKKDMSIDEATAAFWTDARARLQPYYRGALYFIVTDSRIRQTTGGKITLDDLLRQFLEAYRQGHAVTAQDWLALVKHTIGDIAVKDFNDLQQGGFLLPEDAAFGACFTRQQIQLPVFELGFDISSLMQQPRVIRGLNPNSPAAKAGLRESDKIVKSVGLDEQQSRLGEPLVLAVERDGTVQEISFIPVGELTTGYQWRKRNNIEQDESCRL